MDIDKLERIVSKEMEGKGAAHDINHAKRVLNLAKEIADKSGNVNVKLLAAMCLLHDIVRIEGEDESNSVSLSSERSVMLLEKCGFAEDEVRSVIEGIKCHSLTSRGGDISDMVREPQTIEEKILFDADKIDALGPIGVARWFSSTSHRKWDLEKSAKTYLKIMNNFIKLKGGLYTVHGSALAKKRIDYSEKYMQQLLDHLSDSDGDG
jgi:uncharacterized protein